MENGMHLTGPYVETAGFTVICGLKGVLYALHQQTREWASIHMGDPVVFGQPLKQWHYDEVYDKCGDRKEFVLGQESEKLKKDFKDWLAPIVLRDVTPSFDKNASSEPRQKRTVEEFEEQQSKKPVVMVPEPTTKELQVWCKLNICSLLKIAYGDTDEHIASLGGEKELLTLANGYVDLYERLRKLDGGGGSAAD